MKDSFAKSMKFLFAVRGEIKMIRRIDGILWMILLKPTSLTQSDMDKHSDGKALFAASVGSVSKQFMAHCAAAPAVAALMEVSTP